MYDFHSQYLPKFLADLTMAIWYAILIVLAIGVAFEPAAEFRYLAL